MENDSYYLTCHLSELIVSDVIHICFLTNKKKHHHCFSNAWRCISHVLRQTSSSPAQLFHFTDMTLTLFMNSFNGINVFGQRFHVNSGGHRSC